MSNILDCRKTDLGERVYYELLKSKSASTNQQHLQATASSSGVKKSPSNQEFSAAFNQLKANVVDKSMQLFGKIFKESTSSSSSPKISSSATNQGAKPEETPKFIKDLHPKDNDLLYDYDLQMALALSMSMEDAEESEIRPPPKQ